MTPISTVSVKSALWVLVYPVAPEGKARVVVVVLRADIVVTRELSKLSNKDGASVTNDEKFSGIFWSDAEVPKTDATASVTIGTSVGSLTVIDALCVDRSGALWVPTAIVATIWYDVELWSFAEAV